MLMHVLFHVLCVNLTGWLGSLNVAGKNHQRRIETIGRSHGDNRSIFLPAIIIAVHHLY